MKALSIHQPWAWAILHAGKSIENRTWATRHRGPLLIHASKSDASYKAQTGIDWLTTYGAELPPWEALPTGAIVGVVEVLDCVRASEAPTSPWVKGPWCWIFSNPKPFSVPVPCRGLQMLFEVAGDWANEVEFYTVAGKGLGQRLDG